MAVHIELTVYVYIFCKNSVFSYLIHLIILLGDLLGTPQGPEVGPSHHFVHFMNIQ